MIEKQTSSSTSASITKKAFRIRNMSISRHFCTYTQLTNCIYTNTPQNIKNKWVLKKSSVERWAVREKQSGMASLKTQFQNWILWNGFGFDLGFVDAFIDEIEEVVDIWPLKEDKRVVFCNRWGRELSTFKFN